MLSKADAKDAKPKNNGQLISVDVNVSFSCNQNFDFTNNKDYTRDDFINSKNARVDALKDFKSYA